MRRVRVVSLLATGEPMTAPENPPKLWALTVRVGSPRFSELQTFAHPDPADAREQHACVEDKDQVSPVAEYVLASTAAAEREAAVKAAREKFADLIEKADDLADDLVGRPRSSEVTEALRRERDVLLARVEKLREALSTVERQTRGASDEADARIAWDVAGDAILADNEAKAAGKGVG